MLFTTKFTSALVAIAAAAFPVRSAVVARHELAELSVVFFDDVSYTGASFASNTLVQGVCNTLVGNWLDRAESVQIGTGYSCTFFEFQGCEGPGTVLSGNTPQLPNNLYNNVESFFCSKAI